MNKTRLFCWADHFASSSGGSGLLSPFNPLRLLLLTVAVLIGLASFGCGPGDELRVLGGDGIVRGTILDGLSPSEPAAQTRVSLLGVESASGSTLPDGTYEIRGIPPGLYDLVADKTIDGVNRRVRLRFIEVTRDQVLDLPDLSLDLPGTIIGEAALAGSGPGNPVALDNAGIKVSVIGTTLTALTDAAGVYTLNPVEIGEYALRFEKDAFHSQVVQPVSVARGAITTVAPVLLDRLDPPLTGALQGVIALEAAPSGDASGITVKLEGTSLTQVTTPGGNWSFPDLHVGSYQVRFTHPDYFDGLQENLLVVSGTPVTEAPNLTLSNHQVIQQGLSISGLSLSPSGNQIAYLTNSGNNSEIGILLPVENGSFQTLSSGAQAAAGRGIEWRPDESEIFFTRFTGDAVNAFQPARISNTGQGVRGLLAAGTDYFLGTFSPGRGSEFAFYLTNNLQAAQLGTDSLGRTTLETGTIRTLATSLGQLTDLGGIEWGNTGRLIFDREAGTGAPAEVFSVLASGQFPAVSLGPRRVDPPTDTGQLLSGRFQSPSFSGNFARIAFSLEANSGTDPGGIYIVDVDGSNARQISTESGKYLDWSADGKRIYYAREADGIPAVLKVPRGLQ
jgi:hypothetical protein